MLKPVMTVAAVLAIAGSSVVYAQQRLGGAGGDGDGTRVVQRYRPSIDDIKAFADARIAAVKAGLELTPDQEKNWPQFEQAVRDLVKLRIQYIEARRAREAAGDQQTPANPFDRLQQRAEAMSQRSAALKHVADAGAPLYQSLDDAQKHRFKFLAHMLRPHRTAAAFWRHGERDGRGPFAPGGYFRHGGDGAQRMMGPGGNPDTPDTDSL